MVLSGGRGYDAMEWLAGGWIEANPVAAGISLGVVVLLTLVYLAGRARR
jgi:hypothetical protein